MSQISVVHYSPPLNNVLQQNNISNKQNERQIIVIRKPQHILPQPKVLEEDDILLTNNAKKKPKSIRETKPNAQSISVARRNARERNRVKQVNNGFANLRQHIPSFIAAAFESNSGRGGNKKLSKVETLRMAVEYIKSLEEILNMNTDNSEIMDHLADFPYPSPSSSTSPSHSSNTNMTYCYQALSPPFDDDELSNSSQSSHQQFIKLSNNQSFQIIPHTVMENGENLDPMVVDENMMQHSSILNQNLEFSVSSQDLTYLSSMHTTGSMSPGLYSDSSLSPIHNIKSDPNAYITVFNTPPEERQSPGLTIKVEDNCDMPVISLKTEQELSHEHKENIANVLEWWEQQPQNVHS